MGLATWITAQDQAIDRTLAQWNVAFSIFEAISPGTMRQVTVNPHHETDSWYQKIFFPRKRHDNFRDAYSWSDLGLRIFLGAHKHELFEMLLAGDTIANNFDASADKASATSYKDNIQHWNYAWRENYRCGYGVKKGLINIAAIFNPLNCYRAIVDTFSHNGLRLIANTKNLSTYDSTTKKFFGYLGGGILCSIGSLLGAPLRLVEFMASPVKPLWNCHAYNIENKAIGKRTSYTGWAIASAFSTLNILLLFGLITALAIPVITNVANKIVESIGINVVTDFVAEKVLVPLAKDITLNDTADLKNGDLNSHVSAAAIVTTATLTVPGNSATAVPSLNAFKKLHHAPDKLAKETNTPYPDYYAAKVSFS